MAAAEDIKWPLLQLLRRGLARAPAQLDSLKAGDPSPGTHYYFRRKCGQQGCGFGTIIILEQRDRAQVDFRIHPSVYW